MLTPAELVWLIAAVAKGDEAAFERLYGATRAKLYGVVLRILRRQDLAEEVIQETYVKIWNSAGQFNPTLASPITWMASIARNRAIDLVRKRTELSIEEEEQLEAVFAWLNANLPYPPFASSGWSRNAVAWFKDSAADAIRQFRTLSALLEHHDRGVRMLMSGNPGKMLYEDRFQVVVEEWRSL